ncbi:MAG TPA: hypothetical protein VGK74_14330 [Symbiobacteriaceae bacterium]|jgi:uncharacterized small protein (DUF1192 family)
MSQPHDDAQAPRLRRTLIGVSPVAAERHLADEEAKFAAQTAELERQIAEEQAEIGRLRAEIKRQTDRLSTAHNAVTILRAKLAEERAAKAVLVARLIEQQPPVPEEAKSPELSEMRFEGIRLGAESQREHDAVRDLVEELYRTAYARGALPTGLEVRIPAPRPPVPAEEVPPEPVAGAGPKAARWHRFLLGKVVGRTLSLPDGRTIAREGDAITDETIRTADEAGLLFELILPMKLPEVIEDL